MQEAAPPSFPKRNEIVESLALRTATVSTRDISRYGTSRMAFTASPKNPSSCVL